MNLLRPIERVLNENAEYKLTEYELCMCQHCEVH